MFSNTKIIVGYRYDRFSLKMTVKNFEYLTVEFLKFEFSNYIFHIVFHLCTITKWYNHQIIIDWHHISDFIIHEYETLPGPVGPEFYVLTKWLRFPRKMVTMVCLIMVSRFSQKTELNEKCNTTLISWPLFSTQ